MADPAQNNGWTIETYVAHNEALRRADEKFQYERDRRYAEVDIEREKALKIKEAADRAALDLAREIQKYKDKKANMLREQINAERGNYATHSELQAMSDKAEALIKPIADFVTSHHALDKSSDQIKALLYVVAGGVITFLVLEVLRN